jgi:hypothetical protein
MGRCITATVSTAFYPAMGEAYNHGQWSFTTSRLMLLLEDDPELALYFELCMSVRFELNASATLI